MAFLDCLWTSFLDGFWIDFWIAFEWLLDGNVKRTYNPRQGDRSCTF